MIDFAIRQILKLVRKRSRIAVLIEIKDSPWGPEYFFTCCGHTSPLEIVSTLEQVSRHIAEDLERDQVKKLLEEFSK